jgi:hemerythrin-like domain-containing protein
MTFATLGRRPAQLPDATTFLTDCHARIRHFTAMALRIASAATSPPQEVAEAARAVHRYFTVALPLHVADEDLSLLPRLRPVAPALEGALARMEDEHLAIEEAVAEMAPLCSVLAEEPERLGELGEALAEKARALEALFEPHLREEERTIFPAIRQHLPPDEQAILLAEMRARRALQQGTG